MQKAMLSVVMAAVVASFAGVIFAGSNTLGGDPSNSMAACSANSITLNVGSSTTCGNWTVTLLNAGSIQTGNDNSVANVPVALFSVYLNTGLLGRVDLRAIRVTQNETGRACFHEANGVLRGDEGMGINHDCLFLTATGISSSSATINLHSAVRNQSTEDLNSQGEDEHGGLQNHPNSTEQNDTEHNS